MVCTPASLPSSCPHAPLAIKTGIDSFQLRLRSTGHAFQDTPGDPQCCSPEDDTLRLRHSVFCVAFPFVTLARLGEGILLAYKASRGVCSMQDVAFPDARDTTELTRIFGRRSPETFLLRLRRERPWFASSKELNLTVTQSRRHGAAIYRPPPARRIHFCCDFIKTATFFDQPPPVTSLRSRLSSLRRRRALHPGAMMLTLRVRND
ncbi:hypothetical protein DFP72DRAFT_531151 [Ephemerocybe angulata]|uniref:Uncharacterized protein n=1 Tax=Ephemerocybe angulata TaxID=980116 RepID=A0A8H6MFJ7_9AGAR|nr:hypothetical protein DFP72DRAFT_531151 [Tulosesus angulatus]